MHGCQWQYYIKTFVLVILLLPSLLLANDGTVEKKVKLAEIKKSIALLDERIQHQSQEKAQLQAVLQEAKDTEQALLQVLAATKKDIINVQRKQTNLNKKITQTKQQSLSQKEILIQEIQLMYRMGPVEQLKLWLNQIDPAQAYRMQRYFSYIHRAREQHMQTLEQQFMTLSAQEQQLNAYATDLKLLQATQEQESTLLQANREQQQKVLLALEQDISTQTQQRNELLADQQALEALLNELATTQASVSPPPSAGNVVMGDNFAQQKNRLPWPIKGTVHYRFGQPRAGELKWEGLFIQAELETPVDAIYPGRVIYAQRLRGFGLLLIIDHGNNYMSLYGNNKVLYKKVGDFVNIGERIAAVGSGGEHLPEPGLYFEIRLSGQPQDPTKWLVPT